MDDLQQIRSSLLARTRCSICSADKFPLVINKPGVGNEWFHLYEDGSLIGPCFDPVVAVALVAWENVIKKNKKEK